MSCPRCNSLLPTNANFCPNCGSQVALAATGTTQRLDSSQPISIYGTLAEGICPKCHCTEIYTSERGLIAGTPAVLNLHDIWRGTATINSYLCSKCGYIELFMADAKHLPDIFQTWKRVG